MDLQENFLRWEKKIKISLRLDPDDLGVFSHRFSRIWNMTIREEAVSLTTSGHIWAGSPLTHGVIERIQEVVARDPKSRIFRDQVKQKQLYWDLAKLLPSFKWSGQPGDWKDLMKTMSGSKPMNPIFKCFLNT